MPRPTGLAHDQLHVVVFGDGEGESIAVCAPPHTWLVVDSMRWRGTAANPAIQLLDDHETTWSALVLTHPHVDHATGFDELVGHGGDGPIGSAIPPITEFEASDSFARRYRAGEAIKAIEAITASWTANHGQEWNFALTLAAKNVGALRVEPLWPGPQGATGVDPTQFNRLSTPLLVSWNHVRLLLGADLPGPAWARLVSTHGVAFTNADLLKSAHHGSRDSQHPAVVRAITQHRVATAKSTSRLPDFRDGHGVERLLAGANQLHCTALPFDFPRPTLTRVEGRDVQYPAATGFRATVPLPPRSSAQESWHLTTFDASGAVSCSFGSAARQITG